MLTRKQIIVLVFLAGSAIWVPACQHVAVHHPEKMGGPAPSLPAAPGGTSGDLQYNNSGEFGGDSGITTNGSGQLTATRFVGPVTGNVTGNASGTAANVTGTVAIANGGTGQTSQSAGLTALLGSSIVPAANGGAGSANGLLKANGSGAVSAATSGTDFAPAAGDASITTVGTVGTGTWQATPVAAAYVGSLPGSQIGSGTVGTAHLGSGTASSSNLRGDQSWASPSASDVGLGNVLNLAQSPALTVIPVSTAASITAAINSYYPANTSINPQTFTLPNAPANGSLITFKLVGQTGTNAATINAAGSDVFNYVGGSVSLSLSYLNETITVLYANAATTGTVGIWYVLDVHPLAQLNALYVTQASANQPNGYPPLNGSGQLVGTFIQRNGTAAGLASVQLSQAQAAYATDTGQNVVGDGTALFSALAGWSGGTTTAGNVGQFSIINAKSFVGFPTASMFTPAAGCVDLQGSRASTWQTAQVNDSFVSGYGNVTASLSDTSPPGMAAIGSGNTVWTAGNSGGSASFGLGSNNIAASYGAFAFGSNHIVSGYQAAAFGSTAQASGAYSVAVGYAACTGYDPLACTISGGTATITANGDFRKQLAPSSVGRAPVLLNNVSGGTANTNFGYYTSSVVPAYSSPSTTVAVSAGDRTGGYLSNQASTLSPGYQATAISGGRAMSSGSFAMGPGALAYKPSQFAQAGVSLGGTATNGVYPYTILNTAATGSGVVNGPGLSQYTRTTLCAQSTSASSVIMTTNGASASYGQGTYAESTSNTIDVQNNKTLDCMIRITGRSTAGASNGSFVRRAVIKNIAGTTSLVGLVQTVGTDITDGGAALWTIAITADATNNCLQISVTGDTGGLLDTTPVNWVATVEANEVVL